MRDGVMKDSDTLDGMLASICRLHYNLARQRLDDTGLHRGQPRVLFALKAQDGRSHSELAEFLEVTPATVTNTIKRMEQAGFVERRRSQDDERVSRVYLTDAGRAVCSKVDFFMEQMEVSTFAGFSDEEKEQMRGYFRRMASNLRAAIGQNRVCERPEHCGE